MINDNNQIVSLQKNNNNIFFYYDFKKFEEFEKYKVKYLLTDINYHYYYRNNLLTKKQITKKDKNTIFDKTICIINIYYTNYLIFKKILNTIKDYNNEIYNNYLLYKLLLLFI